MTLDRPPLPMMVGWNLTMKDQTNLQTRQVQQISWRSDGGRRRRVRSRDGVQGTSRRRGKAREERKEDARCLPVIFCVGGVGCGSLLGLRLILGGRHGVRRMNREQAEGVGSKAPAWTRSTKVIRIGLQNHDTSQSRS